MDTLKARCVWPQLLSVWMNKNICASCRKMLNEVKHLNCHCLYFILWTWITRLQSQMPYLPYFFVNIWQTWECFWVRAELKVCSCCMHWASLLPLLSFRTLSLALYPSAYHHRQTDWGHFIPRMMLSNCRADKLCITRQLKVKRAIWESSCFWNNWNVSKQYVCT